MKKFFQSFRYAGNGLLWFALTDRNGKVHFACMLLAIILGFAFHITNTEWCIIIICFGLVIALEMINHAIEQFCNDYHAGYKEAIKTIKDVSAAAVLWASIMSAIVGTIIFWPYCSAMLHQV
jgi:diacylglycerol kinase